jgi:hypothetical protein
VQWLDATGATSMVASSTFSTALLNSNTDWRGARKYQIGSYSVFFFETVWYYYYSFRYESYEPQQE